MSNERSESDVPQLVSDAYREIASERTPEALNQEILRQAAAASKPSFMGLIPYTSWMKPLAWMATIALSLAIVLELSEIQPVTTREPTMSSPAPASTQPIPPDASDRADAADTATDQLGAVRQEIGRNDAVPSPSSPARDDEVELTVPAPSQEFTKIQPSVVPDARTRAESIARPMSQKATAAADGCDEATRESPETWKECIQSLRDRGQIDQADREYEAFVARYPPE